MVLLYEKAVRTPAGLARELRHLDPDAGIRLEGEYTRRPCFAFVTRFLGTYTLMICERKGGRTGKVGDRLLSKDFHSADELLEFLKDFSRKKLVAYLY